MRKEQITNLRMQGLLMAAVVTTAVSMVDPAWADLSTSVGSSVSTVWTPLIRVLGYLCYLIAVIMAIGGVIKLNAHATNPTSTPMSHGVVRCAIAAALAAIPNLVGLLASTGGNTMGGAAGFGDLGKGLNLQ